MNYREQKEEEKAKLEQCLSKRQCVKKRDIKRQLKEIAISENVVIFMRCDVCGYLYNKED